VAAVSEVSTVGRHFKLAGRTQPNTLLGSCVRDRPHLPEPPPFWYDSGLDYWVRFPAWPRTLLLPSTLMPVL
jgi:hypothetical protein